VVSRFGDALRGAALPLLAVSLTSFSGETSFRGGDFGTRHSVLLVVDCLYARVAQLTYERATASIALTSHIAEGHAARPRRR
jgi:DNA-binding MurR/RpiR family transcriptional regulator